MTYSQLRRQVESARGNRRKLANNTYAVLRGDAVAVTLHATDVLLYTPDGKVRFDTGGWRTVTTKDRINTFGPGGVTVYSRKGDWRVTYPGGEVPFADGITFSTDESGHLHPVLGTYPDPIEEERVAKAAKKLSADIKAYCEKAKPVLAKWQETLRLTGGLNTAGDCFYCIGIVTDAATGQRADDNGHLWSHLREQYVFPSLFLNAYADKGYVDPKHAFGTAVLYGHHTEVCRVLTGYLKKRLSAVAEPIEPIDTRLEGYVEAAREALTRPSDFGYFGSDDNLWAYSAPTWTKTRDSENEDLANYEFVWNHLKSEFPDLFTHLDGEERTVDRDFNAWPAVYEFGAGHWAVGHIDQIVVPVVKDRDRPVGADNLHPAFIRVLEFVYAARDYPLLDGAEDYLAALDAEDQQKAARQYLGEGLSDEDYGKVIAVVAREHDDIWDAEGEDWYRAARHVGVDPGEWLTERYAGSVRESVLGPGLWDAERVDGSTNLGFRSREEAQQWADGGPLQADAEGQQPLL